MEHAPFSPIASTSRQPYLVDSPFVQTSDIGELEEEQAASGGERYWSRNRLARKNRKITVDSQQPVNPPTSDDELAMSPIRPTKSLPSSSSSTAQVSTKSRPKRPRSPSPTSDAPVLSSRTSPAPLRPSTEESFTSPRYLDSKKGRFVSPVHSDDSSGTLKEITQQRPPRQLSKSPETSSPARSIPTPSKASPSPRRSPSPEEDFPVLPPSPPAGRSFRTRTAAQLKPFSTEQFRYTKTLLKNGWEGAVVAGPKAVELSAEEIRRKKLEQAGKKKDNLGGWLVEEEEAESGTSGRATGMANQIHSSAGLSAEDEEESEDGLSLLEREARRKERMRKETEAGLGIKKKKRNRTRSSSPRRKGPSRIDAVERTAPNPLFVKKQPKKAQPNRRRAESEPPTSSPGATSKHLKKTRPRALGNSKHPHRQATTEQDQSGKKRKSAPARADSEPPASSPARPRPFVSKSNNPRMAKPSKSVHARAGRNERNALDVDILNLPSITSSDSDSDDIQVQSLDGESEVPEESDDEEEDEGSEAEEGEEESSEDRRSRLRLDSKRQRALGAMLPAVFFKKAKADLKLMEKERDMGFSSGSEVNSGDEEAEEARRNRAKVRTVSGMLNEPMRLGGDAFTDESGEEIERTDSEAEQEQREENDAVSAWMRNFAPKRARGGQDDEVDIVDRFLKRARRPTKGAGRKNGGGGRTGDKTVKGTKKSKGKEKAKVSGKEKAGRERGKNKEREAQAGGSTKPSRQPAKAVHLDTDRSIFVLAGLRNELDNDDDDIQILPAASVRALQDLPKATAPSSIAQPPLPPGTGQAPEPEENHEIWATFGKFTPDFGIQRLPPGVQFASTESFVRNGHLYSLLNPASTSLLSCFVYGITLDSSATPETIESHLPTLVDAIYDSICTFSTLSGEQEITAPTTEAGRALRYLGNFVSSTLKPSSSDTKHRFGSALATQLDHLQVRIDNLQVEGDRSRAVNQVRILLSWYSIDLTARLGAISAVGGDSRRLSRLTKNLIRLLIYHGIDRSLVKLKKVMHDSSTSQLLVEDVTIEAWLGLISLATRSGGGGGGEAAYDENDFWTAVMEETLARLPESARGPGPVAAEILSLTALFLNAVSQFSPSGISTSQPRLRAFWPLMVRCLDTIKVNALAGPNHSVSSTAIARRDRYLWNLFARCLILVERWHWKMDVKDDLLGKFFDLLAARRLADLSTEPVPDFPAQLVNLDKFGDIVLESSSDTAFSIFLKLVTSAVQNLPRSTDAEKRKHSAQLTRLAIRLVPMTTVWNRQSPELMKNDSILVNHYSHLLTLAILHPTQAAQRAEQASKLIAFGDTEEESRKTTVRAIRYWALAFRHFGLPLEPLLDWLGKIVSQLTTEYLDIDKQKRIERKDKSKEDQLWPRALLITMSLRLVQDVLRWEKPGAGEEDRFPDPALLHPSWTSKLLQSALALDPMIGREVLKTIDCYLNLRARALQALAPPARTESSLVQQDSQDDYGMDEFDFADPALGALLGEGDGVQAVNPDQAQVVSSDVLETDKVLAKTIQSNLAPAFFSLTSRIYGNSISSGPTIGDKSSYANDVIDSWTRCLAILVSHRLDNWSAYLQYGNHSFQRIGDALGKLDTGLFLSVHILQHDPSVLSICSDEILTIWFTSIVSSKLTSQHLLTEVLLNSQTPSPLFDNSPFARSPSTDRVEIEQLELLDKRVDFLRIVFLNAARISNFRPSAAAPFAKPPILKTVIMRFLREMLSAMRTYFTSIRDEMAQRSYAKLVKEVLGALTSSTVDRQLSPFTETTLPDIAILRAQISAYL